MDVKNPDSDQCADDLDFNDAAFQRLLDNPLSAIDNSRLRNSEQHKGFDNNMGDTWIYPSNLPCRSYQLSIAKAALYRNTLVVLPTGLGKTFIAAVVMYNIYRWYPCGKVIFMAPTRPLVNQQIEACQKIMPFPCDDVAELTGKLAKQRRHKLWQTKRVFFVTPQVLQSDMCGPDDNYPHSAVKLMVVDEAHKAKGRYAYVEVIQTLLQHTKYFRVLALSATPGRTIDDVAEVCRNLLISHLEVRWDTSIDVTPYVHKRHMETVVVTMGAQIKNTRERLLQIIDPYLKLLTEEGVLSGSLGNLNRNFLLYEQKRFRDRCFRDGRHPHYGAINTNFAICISLYHALELLEHHGVRVFLNNFEEDEEGKGKFILQMDHQLRNLIEELKSEVGANPFDVSVGVMTNGQIAEVPKNLDFGHPKFEKARQYLRQHFEAHADSRAIVFCEFRESVLLIYRMLLQEKPLLRPRCFVGQGGSTGALRALTQKQQIQIMSDFRKGDSNILIATSVGEEGIDVGEVELIVCFDISTSNPTRFVQRIGRTGRKKNGNVVMLVSEGREQQLLKEVMINKDQINKKLLRSTVIKEALYPNSPRLVPSEFQPQCVHMFIKPDNKGAANSKLEKTTKAKIKKAPNVKDSKGTKRVHQDLRKFLTTKADTNNDEEENEFFDIDGIKTQPKPGVQTQEKMSKKLVTIKGVFNDLFKDLQTTTTTQHFVSQEEKNRQSTNDLTARRDNEPPSTSEKSLTAKTTTTTNTDATHLRRVNKLLKTTLNTPDVLARAEINDLSHHIKSGDMSAEMKRTLLKLYPDFVKENLEKMKILQALNQEQDVEDDTETIFTAEEKSVRDVNKIILELFGGIAQVEDFVYDCQLQQLKNHSDILNLEHTSDKYADVEENYFQLLDEIFEGFGNVGPNVDNYEEIMQEFRKTTRYKEFVQQQAQHESSLNNDNYEESMAYDFDLNNVEHDLKAMPTESKCCDQWLLNCERIQHKSTPIQKAHTQAKTKVNNEATDGGGENLLLNQTQGPEISMQAIEELNKSCTRLRNQTPDSLRSPGKASITQSSSLKHSWTDNDDELFLQIFPEEEAFMEQQKQQLEKTRSRCNSFKENLCNPSPDLFTNESLNKTAKIQCESKPVPLCELQLKSPPLPTTTTTTITPTNNKQQTPKRNFVRVDKELEKSPNIFDLFMKNSRGKGKLPRVPSINQSLRKENAVLNRTVSSPLFKPKNRCHPPKTIIFESSESDSPDQTNQTEEDLSAIKMQNNDNKEEEEGEEIAATQTIPPTKSAGRRIRKRTFLNKFIQHEAVVSGEEGSGDETEHTLDHYHYDSMIVSSDDEFEDGESHNNQLSRTHIQAMYLQSIKSPQQRRGAFKIPAPRHYNDQSHIFSQAVLPADMASQYITDSFVIDDELAAEESHNAEQTLCPLEKAEKILKEKRKAKRKYAKIVEIETKVKSRRRRVQQLYDSSDDEET